MSDFEDNEMDLHQSNKFLAAMSTLEGGRRRFLHGTDDSQVLEKPLSEITGAKLTVNSLLFDTDETQEHENKEKKRKKKKKKQLLNEKEANQLEGDLEKIYKRTVEKPKQNLSLPAPLSTPQALQASREAVYKKVSKDMAQWDAVIHGRRAATQVTFPLEKPDLKLKSVGDHNSTHFTPRTALEAEVMAALHGAPVPDDANGQSKIKAGLSLKEQWLQMQEMSRLKSHMRYQEAKIARQNKIKSKSYRRHLRRQKAKEKAKELEELKRTDPELAAEKEAALGNNRILERATLKHSKANKNKKLAFKIQADKKSGDKSTNSSVKAILDTMTQKKKSLMTREANIDEQEDSSGDENDVTGNEKEMQFNADVLLSEEQNPWLSKTDNIEPLEIGMKERMNKMLAQMEKKSDQGNMNVNPKDYAVVKEKCLVNIPSNRHSDDDDEVDEASGDEEKRQQIGEIFAEDDLIAEEFAEEKFAKRKKKKNDLHLSLPGWGKWSGQEKTGPRRKRPIDKVKLGANFDKAMAETKKKKTDVCTRDEHVIIGDDKAGLREKQSSVVPFPYTSVSDFEASLRLPLGDTFIPRTSHKKIIRPKLKVPLGTVVEPMDKQALVRRGILPPSAIDICD